ncbi:MAG: hypothetical protein LBK23_05220 [Oscillospiraceae bacterium]|jgi:hypothetical protein|nr:hypothetical protein [Oscillospiraceae bacterium]
MASAALKNEGYMYSGAIRAEIPEAAPAAPRAAAGAVARPREAARPRVSMFSVLGFMFIIALAGACILSNVELAEISADITGIRAVPPRIRAQSGIVDKLSERREENSALRVDYERAFDLKEIERYAVEELGMIRTQSAGTRPVESAPEDKAVIPASESAPGGAAGLIARLMEYFK